MANPRYPLTPALQRQICAYIRAGGFAQVAAEATGIPRAVFCRWLRRGQGRQAREPYRGFAAAVMQAAAEARLAAETSVFTDSPLNWLKFGPGKENPGAPGWTTSARPHPPRSSRGRELAQDPEWSNLLGNLLHLLTPFPEARAALAQRLGEMTSR